MASERRARRSCMSPCSALPCATPALSSRSAAPAVVQRQQGPRELAALHFSSCVRHGLSAQNINWYTSMASQQQQQQSNAGGQLQHQSQNGQVAGPSSGSQQQQQQQQGEGARDKDTQDPQFHSLQKAAQVLSSRANSDARIEQASELSEVLNCTCETASPSSLAHLLDSRVMEVKDRQSC